MKELERQRDRATEFIADATEAFAKGKTPDTADILEVLRTIMALLQDAAWRLDTLEQSSHEHYGETT